MFDQASTRITAHRPSEHTLALEARPTRRGHALAARQSTGDSRQDDTHTQTMEQALVLRVGEEPHRHDLVSDQKGGVDKREQRAEQRSILGTGKGTNQMQDPKTEALARLLAEVKE